jgi:hypothetical protein
MSSDPLRDSYVRAVIASYLALHDSPGRAHPGDRRVAEELYRRGVAVPTIQNAFLLAQARRLTSRANGNPLPPVRSLAYFRGAIDEILERPLDNDYLRYLIRSIGRVTRPQPTAGGPGSCSKKGGLE